VVASTRSAKGNDVYDPRHDRGQAALLVVATATVLLAAMLWAAAAMGGVVVDRTRARTAADAAALASLDGDRSTATEIAARHGAVVVSWSRRGDEVTVVVRVGEVSATARATDRWDR
jgi:hypothetical protein